MPKSKTTSSLSSKKNVSTASASKPGSRGKNGESVGKKPVRATASESKTNPRKIAQKQRPPKKPLDSEMVEAILRERFIKKSARPLAKQPASKGVTKAKGSKAVSKPAPRSKKGTSASEASEKEKEKPKASSVPRGKGKNPEELEVMETDDEEDVSSLSSSWKTFGTSPNNQANFRTTVREERMRKKVKNLLKLREELLTKNSTSGETAIGDSSPGKNPSVRKGDDASSVSNEEDNAGGTPNKKSKKMTLEKCESELAKLRAHPLSPLENGSEYGKYFAVPFDETAEGKVINAFIGGGARGTMMHGGAITYSTEAKEAMADAIKSFNLELSYRALCLKPKDNKSIMKEDHVLMAYELMTANRFVV